MTTKRGLAAFFVVMTVAASMLWAPRAIASHGAGYDAGDYKIVFTPCSLHPTTNWAVVKHITHDVDDFPEGPATTDVDAEYRTTADCVDVDVRIADSVIEPEPTTLLGRYVCVKWHDSNTCDHGHARINQGNDVIPDDGEMNPTTDQGLWTVAAVCHETGHAMGLGHSTETSSCMQAEIPEVADRHFTSHDMYVVDAYHNPSPLD